MTHPSQIPEAGRALTPEERDAIVQEMAEIVARSHLFKSLDDAGRASVLASGYVVSYEAGSELMRQHEPGDTMMLLLRGQVQVRTETPAGEVHLAQLGRGAVIGEVALLHGAARTATVTATNEVDAVAFTRPRIERILDAHPKVRALLESLVERRAADTIEKMLA